MKRSQVRDFIKAGVDKLQLDFGFGRPSEFSSKRDSQYPIVWLDSLSVDVELSPIGTPINSWVVVLYIMDKDKAGSSTAEYEDTVDGCDFIAQKLIRLYDQAISGYKLVQIVGIRREPYIHKFADDASGVILSFTLTDPDKTDVC